MNMRFLFFRQKSIITLLIFLFFFLFFQIKITRATAYEGSIYISTPTGGTCSLAGVWDSINKTCTLTNDIVGYVSISGEGITLDGAGYIIQRPSGVQKVTTGIWGGWKNFTLKNVIVRGFSTGLNLQQSSGATIRDSTFKSNGSNGIYMSGGGNNKIINNIFISNFYAIYIGSGGSGESHLIENNTFSKSVRAIHINFSQTNPIIIRNNLIQNNRYGIHNYNGHKVTITRNTIRNNIGFGLYDSSVFISNNYVFQNNFIANGVGPTNFGQINGNISAYLNKPLPDGGNYWDDFDTSVEGCTDADLNNICDTPRYINTYTSVGDFFPWTTENGWLGVSEPPTFYAEIKNTTNGFATIYSSGNLSGEAIKTLPNGWIIQVIAKTDEVGQPVIADGHRWYKISDPTDGSAGWMPAKTDSSTPTIFLSYEANRQTEFIDKSTTIITDEIARKETIIDIIDHYYNDATASANLYSSNDGPLNLSLFQNILFPKELILAIIAQEAPDNIDNEHVSFDYGHGVTQTTFHAWANEPDNYKDNNWDNRGKRSNVKIIKCKNILSDPPPHEKDIGLSEYKKCYENTSTKNLLIKPYKHYNNDPTAPIYKQYTNTEQSFFANIKDGLGVLREKYKAKCPKPDILIEGESFSCSDIEKILMTWGYNGFAKNRATGKYTGNYLQLVANRLENLPIYFPVNLYSNDDHLIQKLNIANANKKTVKLYSPAELRIVDSYGNITGVENGIIKEEIPNSAYDSDQEGAIVLFPDNLVSYKVAGTEEGQYGILIDSATNGTQTMFNGIDLPITEDEIHIYSVNEELLLAGKLGVTLLIDSNGDGVPERNLLVGAVLDDITPPEIYISPVSQNFILGQQTIFNAEATDNKDPSPAVSVFLDGIPILLNSPIILGTVGPHTLLIEAVDKTGNIASESITFYVRYKFGGFEPPLHKEKNLQINQTLPVKFKLKDINDEVVHGATGFVSVSDLTDIEILRQPFFENGNSGMYMYLLRGNSVGAGNWILKILPDDGSVFSKNITFMGN